MVPFFSIKDDCECQKDWISCCLVTGLNQNGWISPLKINKMGVDIKGKNYEPIIQGGLWSLIHSGAKSNLIK